MELSKRMQSKDLYLSGQQFGQGLGFSGIRRKGIYYQNEQDLGQELQVSAGDTQAFRFPGQTQICRNTDVRSGMKGSRAGEVRKHSVRWRETNGSE